MLNLKYIGESISYPISFKNISDTICQITGDFPVKAGGFTLSRIGKNDAWNYSGYATVYRRIDGGAQFSNDESVFIPRITFSAGTGGTLNGESTQGAHNYEDLKIPTPVPVGNYVFVGWEPEIPVSGEIPDHQAFRALFLYVPTLEEVQAQKVSELQAAGSVAMSSSVEYEGVQYPYATGLRDVTENALTTGKSVAVKDVDKNNHELAPSAVKALYISQERNRVNAQEYTAQLVSHVLELSDKEEIGKIIYGVELTEDRKAQYEQAVSAQMGVITAAVDMIEAQAGQARISAESNSDKQALNVVALYANWEDLPEGTTLAVGVRLNYQGVLYKVLTEHQKQATWNPVDAPSLFAKVLIPDPGEIPEWEQPGPENAYSKGDRVTHNGKTWESLVDNNVWEPGVVGTEAQWKEVTE